MKMSEAFTDVIAAIHTVQQNIGVVGRDSTANVGSYSYSYANMTAIWNALRPLLQANGLTVMQPPVHDMLDKLETWIFHESGQWVMTSSRLVINKEDPQAYGSAITYAKRYAACSMLGIFTDNDDNDAAEHRLATAAQKQRLVGAVKQIYPDLTKAEDIIKTLQNITGKYPGNIREDEAEDAIALVRAFTSTIEEEPNPEDTPIVDTGE